MSDDPSVDVPPGAVVHDISPDLFALLSQPEMKDLARLLSMEGRRELLTQLCAMDSESLLSLRARVAPPPVSGPTG